MRGAAPAHRWDRRRYQPGDFLQHHLGTHRDIWTHMYVIYILGHIDTLHGPMDKKTHIDTYDMYPWTYKYITWTRGHLDT